MIILFHFIHSYTNYLWNCYCSRQVSNEVQEIFEKNDNTDELNYTDKPLSEKQVPVVTQSTNSAIDINQTGIPYKTKKIFKFSDENFDFNRAYFISDKIKFYPPVYVQRYLTVDQILREDKWEGKINKIVDFGCSEIKFFKYLKELRGVSEIILVDIDEETLRTNRHRIQPWFCEPFSLNRTKPLTVRLLLGSVTKNDHRLRGVDAVVAIELIEHMYPDELELLPENIFNFIKPRLAVFTTPNSDFNVLFENFTGFRHPDHKFEWSREEFETWAENICMQYPDYEVSFVGIGRPAKGDDHFGCCSQGAVFQRIGDDEVETVDKSGVEAYTEIDTVDFPVYPEVSEKQLTLDEASNFIYRSVDLGEFLAKDQFEIPLSAILIRVYKTCKTSSELKRILEENRFRVETNCDNEEVVVVPDTYIKPESTTDSQEQSDSQEQLEQGIVQRMTDEEWMAEQERMASEVWSNDGAPGSDSEWLIDEVRLSSDENVIDSNSDENAETIKEYLKSLSPLNMHNKGDFEVENVDFSDANVLSNIKPVLETIESVSDLDLSSGQSSMVTIKEPENQLQASKQQSDTFNNSGVPNSSNSEDAVEFIVNDDVKSSSLGFDKVNENSGNILNSPNSVQQLLPHIHTSQSDSKLVSRESNPVDGKDGRIEPIEQHLCVSSASSCLSVISSSKIPLKDKNCNIPIKDNLEDSEDRNRIKENIGETIIKNKSVESLVNLIEKNCRVLSVAAHYLSSPSKTIDSSPKIQDVGNGKKEVERKNSSSANLSGDFSSESFLYRRQSDEVLLQNLNYSQTSDCTWKYLEKDEFPAAGSSSNQDSEGCFCNLHNIQETKTLFRSHSSEHISKRSSPFFKSEDEKTKVDTCMSTSLSVPVGEKTNSNEVIGKKENFCKSDDNKNQSTSFICSEYDDSSGGEHLDIDMAVERVRQDSCSPDKFGPDSGYPNSSSGLDMEMDTPEQVKEIMTESESSLENSPAESPVHDVAHPPVIHLGENVENGDVANNNRDGEGNNMLGPVFIGEPLEFHAIIEEPDEGLPLMDGVAGSLENDEESPFCSRSSSRNGCDCTALELKRTTRLVNDADEKLKDHCKLGNCVKQIKSKALYESDSTVSSSDIFSVRNDRKTLSEDTFSQELGSACDDETHETNGYVVNRKQVVDLVSDNETEHEKSTTFVSDSKYDREVSKHISENDSETSTSLCSKDTPSQNSRLSSLSESSGDRTSEQSTSSANSGTELSSSLSFYDLTGTSENSENSSYILRPSRGSGLELSSDDVLVPLSIFDRVLNLLIQDIVEELLVPIEPFPEWLLNIQLEALMERGEMGLEAEERSNDGNSVSSENELTVEADIKGGGDSANDHN